MSLTPSELDTKENQNLAITEFISNEKNTEMSLQQSKELSESKLNLNAVATSSTVPPLVQPYKKEQRPDVLENNDEVEKVINNASTESVKLGMFE